VRRLAVILLLAGCKQLTLEEHCTESCAFYSECDPELLPLEPECVMACTMRFGDPERVVAVCERSAPKHDIDAFRSVKVVAKSAFEAAECARDQGCPPDMPDMNADDPCEGVEEVCLDGFTHEQLCARAYDIATFDCQVEYQDCIMGGDFNTCQSRFNGCYQAASDRYQDCL
jgi:hypothetical protein